jgi:hypothetical protein
VLSLGLLLQALRKLALGLDLAQGGLLAFAHLGLAPDRLLGGLQQRLELLLGVGLHLRLGLRGTRVGIIRRQPGLVRNRICVLICVVLGMSRLRIDVGRVDDDAARLRLGGLACAVGHLDDIVEARFQPGIATTPEHGLRWVVGRNSCVQDR